MPRVRQIDLVYRVKTLRLLGYDISIEWAYGQPRCYNATGTIILSPRLRTGLMDLWLSGYVMGIEAEREKEMRTGQ